MKQTKGETSETKDLIGERTLLGQTPNTETPNTRNCIVVETHHRYLYEGVRGTGPRGKNRFHVGSWENPILETC